MKNCVGDVRGGKRAIIEGLTHRHGGRENNYDRESIEAIEEIEGAAEKRRMELRLKYE
jgi:hypothetical protein